MKAWHGCLVATERADVMRLSAIIAFVLVVMAGPSAARADIASSARWFDAKTFDDRVVLQASLILVGQYNSLVDGVFGRFTYEAVVRYQKSHGLDGDGVLDEAEENALLAEAFAVYSILGFTEATEGPYGIKVPIPERLLSHESTTRWGTHWTTDDNSIELETLTIPAGDTTFEALYDRLRSVGDRRVSYALFEHDHFVLSGTIGARRFYTAFVRSEDVSHGFSISWAASADKLGSMLSVFLASMVEFPKGTPEPPRWPRTSPGAGAQISSETFDVDDQSITVISIEGELELGDEKRFANVAAGIVNGLVLLSSPGGNLMAGIEIGNTIRSMGFATLVPQGFSCASACALAWLAGTPRWMEEGSQIGFHAATVVGGRCEPGSVGNALVGAYLDQLGLPFTAIAYMTEVSPCEIRWLTFAAARQIGIDVWDFGALSETPAPPRQKTSMETKAPDQDWSGYGSWIQLFSRRTSSEAISLAAAYRNRLEKETAVFRTENGWYAVVTGPFATDAARATLYGLINSGTVPDDSLITSGARFVDMVWGVAPKEESSEGLSAAPLSEAYRVTGVASNDVLFLRSGPGTNYSVVTAIPPDGRDIVVSSCHAIEGYSNKWCEAVWQGHSGWASACCLASQKTGLRPN